MPDIRCVQVTGMRLPRNGHFAGIGRYFFRNGFIHFVLYGPLCRNGSEQQNVPARRMPTTSKRHPHLCQRCDEKTGCRHGNNLQGFFFRVGAEPDNIVLLEKGAILFIPGKGQG